MKLADVQTIYRSDCYQVLDFKCHCDFCSVSNEEYNSSFSMSFIRKGFFGYRTFKREDEMHVGRMLLSKPGFVHTTRHIDNHPDLVTIYDFKKGFFDEVVETYGTKASWFLQNNDIHSVVINTTPELEYSHHLIYQQLLSNKYNSLQIDEMVFSLLEKVILVLANNNVTNIVSDKLKQYHLTTIESARDYIFSHFNDNISLQQLGHHCLVSPFHFSRLFKSIVGQSPHQYLNGIRLVHAKILLAGSSLPVTDIAYECGFNSMEHFVTAFKQYYKINPSAMRRQLVS